MKAYLVDCVVPIVMIAVVVIWIAGDLPPFRRTAVPVASVPAPGQRYYAFPFQSTSLVVLDTETGHCWQKNDFGWRDLGSPK